MSYSYCRIPGPRPCQSLILERIQVFCPWKMAVASPCVLCWPSGPMCRGSQSHQHSRQPSPYWDTCHLQMYSHLLWCPCPHIYVGGHVSLLTLNFRSFLNLHTTTEYIWWQKAIKHKPALLTKKEGTKFQVGVSVVFLKGFGPISSDIACLRKNPSGKCKNNPCMYS